MGSIITLDALNEESEIAQTQENFPALQHRFPFTETTGTVLTDTVNGVGVTTGAIAGDGNALQVPVSANSALAAGAWEQPGSKAIMLVCFTDYMYGYFDVDIGNGPGNNASEIAYGHGRSTPNFHIADGSNTVSDGPGGGTLEPAGNMLQYIPGTSLEFIACPANDLEVITNGATAAASHDMSAVTLPAEGRITAPNTDAYGILIFYFDEIPADSPAALQWMTNEWMNNGNKAIWPGWRGRT